MRVAITGASGFIGRALCEALIDEGYAVVALTRRPDHARRQLPEGTEVATWDFAPGAKLPPCDAVVHLAGESVAGRWTDEKKRLILDSRRFGTRALADAIERADPRPSVLVSASGIGYYGDRGDEVLTEDSSPGDDFLAEVCVAWEEEAARAEAFGLRVASLRLGMALDRDGGALAQMALPFKLGVGGRLGSGNQWVSWIHRADAAGLFQHALENENVRGPLNAVAPNPVQNSEFTRELGKALHRPTFLPVPPAAIKLVLGEFAESVLGGQRALPKAAQESGYRFQYPTLAEALAEIF